MLTDLSLHYIVEELRWNGDHQQPCAGTIVRPGGLRGRPQRTEQTFDVDLLPYSMWFVTPAGKARLAATPPERIVVVCNGQPAGDSACQLAADLAAVTGASVRAITVLEPSQAARRMALSKADPVEALLTGVTQQLYRTTSMPGLWCLTMMVGVWADQVAQACRDNTADLLILPEVECRAIAGTTLGTQTAVPVLCVTASDKVTTKVS